MSGIKTDVNNLVLANVITSACALATLSKNSTVDFVVSKGETILNIDLQARYLPFAP